MSYRTRWVTVASLDEAVRLEMAELYLAIYAGTSLELFLHDLSEKDEVLLITFNDDLVGFTTVKVEDRERERIVYSGDTLVVREHWGQQQLAVAFLARLGDLKRAAPERTLLWFLLVKGHRTFSYLPTFGHSFWPDRADLKPLADELARERFGDEYNAETGVVEFKESRGHLREGYAEPSAAELEKPWVQFFLARNPGYRQGHELVCLCEAELSNMKPLAQRIFVHGA